MRSIQKETIFGMISCFRWKIYIFSTSRKRLEREREIWRLFFWWIMVWTLKCGEVKSRRLLINLVDFHNSRKRGPKSLFQALFVTRCGVVNKIIYWAKGWACCAAVLFVEGWGLFCLLTPVQKERMVFRCFLLSFCVISCRH